MPNPYKHLTFHQIKYSSFGNNRWEYKNTTYLQHTSIDTQRPFSHETGVYTHSGILEILCVLEKNPSVSGFFLVPRKTDGKVARRVLEL